MRNLFRKLFLIATITCCVCETIAQTYSTSDSLKARYQNETIHFFKGYIAKGENGERIRYADLKNQFSMSPEGASEFASFRKKRTASFILASGALSLIIAGSIVRQNNKDLGNGLLIGALVTDIFSIPFGISAGKKLQHAIWLRNRDAVFRGK